MSSGPAKQELRATADAAPIDRDELVSFLKLRENEGPLCPCRIPFPKGANTCQAFTDVDEAADWVARHAEGHSFYVSNNPPKQGWTPRKANPRRDGGDPPSEDDIVHRRRFQLDFDPVEGASLEDAKREARELLDEFCAEAQRKLDAMAADDRPPGRPAVTTIVDSGRGIHAHFDIKPVMSGPAATGVNELMIEWFRARAKLNKVDGVGNTARIMRLPGSFNHKTKTIARVVRHDPDGLSSLAMWSQVLCEPENVPVPAPAAERTIDRRVDDIVRKRAPLDDRKTALLEELVAVQWDSLDKNATPESLGLRDLAIVQAKFCVKTPDDVTEDTEGRPMRREGLPYSNSEPMVAFAGQAMRDGASVVDVCAVLANPNLAISRHVYEKNRSARNRLRAVIRAVAEAICTAELGPQFLATPGFIEFSDDHLAEGFVQEFGEHLRFCNEWGQWLQWDGVRWQRERTLLVYDFARRICRAAAPHSGKRGYSVASANTVSAVERLARADRRLALPSSVFDADPNVLNTPTGIVDLLTGQVRGHDRELYLTKCTAVGPGESASELWLRFLRDVTGGDEEYVAYLQRIVGYMLTGETREHAMFFAWGPGANGKSVFVNTLRYIMGDYATSTPVDTLVVTYGSQHPTDLADLRGARLVTAQETEADQRWAEAKVKMMTGGDRIKARFMRQDFFEYQPQFKLLIAGNHRPGLSSVDQAIRRRFHLLPFVVTIPPDCQDKHLEEKLREDGPAILRWALDGCLAWRREGLRPAAVVRAASAEYLEDEDSLGRWLEECTERVPEGRAKPTDLWDSWRWWCRERNERPRSQKWLGTQLQDRGFKCEKSGERFYPGLALQADERSRIEAARASREDERRLRREALERMGVEPASAVVEDREPPF